MSPADLYLLATINRHRAQPDDPRPQSLLRLLTPLIRRWPLSPHIESIALSGSHAKQTALRAASDLDIFIGFSPATPGPLSAIVPSLAAHFRGHLPLTRNVSLRIRFDGQPVDLVPARRRPGTTHHTLWQSRCGAWLQTDVARQIRHVQSSGLITEILALKLWTHRHHLRFPSFLQELTAIRALTANRPISESFRTLLEFLARSFPTAQLLDPANSNNVVSDVLTPEEKSRIAIAAGRALSAHTWDEIL